MAEPVVYLNGRFVTAGKATVSALDRGLLYGDGLFETLRAYGGRLFRFQAHLRRLAASAAALHLPLPLAASAAAVGLRLSLLPNAGLERIAEDLLRYNNLGDAALRLTVSHGPGDGPDPPPEPSPTLLLTVRPLARDSGLESPVDVIALLHSAPTPALAAHKTLCYLPHLLARAQAKAAGADDALLLNPQGLVTEATTSNLFIVRGDRLLTPRLECGLLPGITRAIVLGLAPEVGLAPEETNLKPEDLSGADECFLTNSVAEITPVRRCDGTAIGTGQFDAARRLHAAYRALVLRELESV